MIWIIGGTSESVELVKSIRGKLKYIVSVATYSGKEVLNDENVAVVRLTYDEMIGFIKDNNIDLIVDMSHPYAVEVTSNAKGAAEEAKVRYIRFVREKTDVEGALCFESLPSCKEFLSSIKGCVFFTTGIKNIKDFEAVRGDNRFIYRIIPSTFSIEECVKNNVKMEDIVAILGPVSEELNSAMFKEYKADYVVMKDSGLKGGTPQKIASCRNLGIIPVVIGRSDEEGVHSMDKLLEMIL